jgi:hypothetical protein
MSGAGEGASRQRLSKWFSAQRGQNSKKEESSRTPCDWPLAANLKVVFAQGEDRKRSKAPCI